MPQSPWLNKNQVAGLTSAIKQNSETNQRINQTLTDFLKEAAEDRARRDLAHAKVLIKLDEHGGRLDDHEDRITKLESRRSARRAQR